MDRWVTVAALFVVLVTLATGPLTGIDVTRPSETTFGDGDATVADVALDRSSLALTPGRFGANVTYLRAPTATVTVDAVTDRPRLIYIVAVPGLDIELVDYAVVTSPGSYRIGPDDRAIPPGVATGSYDATLSVRIQSFTTDRTLSTGNTTVEANG